MNMNAMMAQAKKMQADMEKAKAELQKKEFIVEKQGIKIVMLGNKKLKSVDINEALIDPDDKDIIESLIIIAINEAIDKINAEEAASMPQVPGMF